MKIVVLFCFLLTDLTTISSSEESALAGRCLLIGETPDARTTDLRSIAPGQAPLLSFRVYEGRGRGRFGNNDLMLDDAGH